MNRRLAVWLLGAVLIGLVSSAVTASPTLATIRQADFNVDVSGDDQRDVYRGTGGLLLPGSFSGTSGTRRRVAGCLGCVWRFTVYCDYDNDGMCGHAVVTCPMGKVRYRVWFGRTAESLEVVGSICWANGRPLTRKDVDQHLVQRGERGLPPLRPGYDPPGGTVTGLPVVTWAGQPVLVHPPAFMLSGMRVQLTCSPRWRWQWGDGHDQWTALAGARYPSRQVTHVYRAPGRYRITVTAAWQAQYTVAGLGPFAVAGDQVRQQATLAVRVQSAQVLLTPWNSVQR